MPLRFIVDGLALRQTGVKFRNRDWYLYLSQLNMRHLENGTHTYRNEDVERYIAINSAPTGGGKTGGWADGSVRKRKDTIVLYPTNALTADQVDSISESISENYNAGDKVSTIMLTAPELERERENREGEVGSNGELISTLIREEKREHESVIAFTNPDIFTNLRHGNYQASLAKRVSEIFERVVIDEFHVADTAGKTTILNLVRQLWNNDNTRTDEVIILTATPDDRIKQMLDENDVYEVSTEDEESDLSDVRNDENYNPIQPPIDIEFRRGRTFHVGSQLLSNKWRGDLLDFVRQDQRTIIMLDSKKEVNAVSNFLSRNLNEYESIKIDGDTERGLRDRIRRFNDESSKSVITSNSAVEVGIDFETDQIIFSGMENARFLQRLGRLRNREDKCRAIAYVPANVYEALKRAIDNNIIDDSTDPISRSTLQDILDKAFFHSREPHSYPATFGSHEAYEHALHEANGEAPETQYKVMEQAKKRIERDMMEPYGIEVDWEEFHEVHKQKMDGLIPTLTQYRTSEPSVIIYNDNDDIVSTRGVQDVLRTGDIEIVPRNEFYARVPDKHQSSIKNKESYTNGYVLYYGNEYRRRSIRTNGDDVKGRQIYIKPNSELVHLLNQDPVERFPTELNNYEIIVDEREMSPVDVEILNEYLSNAKPVVYPIQLGPREATKEYNLDKFFFLTEIADGKNTRSSVATGNNALYMYCIRQEQLYRENPEREDLGIRVPNTVWDT